jgi:hypothetical protein
VIVNCLYIYIYFLEVGVAQLTNWEQNENRFVADVKIASTLTNYITVPPTMSELTKKMQYGKPVDRKNHSDGKTILCDVIFK